MMGYFKEQAVISYTKYLDQIDYGNKPNIEASLIAKKYYGLPVNASLRDVVIAVRADEQGHRVTDQIIADLLYGKQ